MTEPLFVTRYKGREWRVSASSFASHSRVSIWPWYQSSGGEMKPCRDGLQVDLDQADALASAIRKAAESLR